MLNAMFGWLAPVIGWVSGLDAVELLWMMLVAGVLPVIALACYAVTLKLDVKVLSRELAWWRDRYKMLSLAREDDDRKAFRDQQELRIKLYKSQDMVSETCNKFNEYMANKDAHVRRLQGDLELANRELSCAKAALRMSGKIYASHIELLDYLDKHCNISVRDEKGRFSGRVTANGLYDARFRQEVYKGDI